MIFLTLLISSAAASYEGDMKHIDQLGHRADGLLSELGFNNSQKKMEVREEKKNALFQTVNFESFKIPAGALVFGKLYTRLVVGGEAVPFIVELNNENQYGMLSNLRVLGHATASPTQGRVSLQMERIILRSGKAVSFDGVGMDSSGAAGLEAQVFSSKALMLAGAMAGSFIAGFAGSQESQTSNAFGFTQSQRSGKNSLLQGVAQTAADQSKNLIDEATKEKPILVVEPGTSVTVFFNEECRL